MKFKKQKLTLISLIEMKGGDSSGRKSLGKTPQGVA